MPKRVKNMVPSLAGEGYCWTDPDPQIDAENKLVTWLGTQYSFLDDA